MKPVFDIDSVLFLVHAALPNPSQQRRHKTSQTDISQTSSRLVNDSKKFKWGAKKLSLMVRACVCVHVLPVYGYAWCGGGPQPPTNPTQLYPRTHTTIQALYQQYAPFLAMGGVLLVVLYLKFFW